MKYLLVFVFVIAASTAVISQEGSNVQFIKDAGGPIKPRLDINMDGSPFLTESYCSANIKVYQGKFYQRIPARLNLLDNKIYFKTDKDEEMETTVPIESIEFTACLEDGNARLFRSGFPEVDKQDTHAFYQVLSAGSVMLLKYHVISFKDDKPYNSTVITRTYSTKYIYYAYSPGKGMVKLTNKESLLQALAGHDKIDKYIAQENINPKKEKDLIKVIDYCNSKS